MKISIIEYLDIAEKMKKLRWCGFNKEMKKKRNTENERDS
jgi:hypothetical protein